MALGFEVGDGEGAGVDVAAWVGTGVDVSEIVGVALGISVGESTGVGVASTDPASVGVGDGSAVIAASDTSFVSVGCGAENGDDGGEGGLATWQATASQSSARTSSAVYLTLGLLWTVDAVLRRRG